MMIAQMENTVFLKLTKKMLSVDINNLLLIKILPGLKIIEEAKSSSALSLTICYAGNNQFVFSSLT